MTEKFDAIVIGTGQAGPSLAVRLAKAGRRTAIIERSLFGGTCVNVGCTPTKTLIASARVAHAVRHGAEYGVMINGDEVRVDMARVKARKDDVVRQSNQGVTRMLKTTPGLVVFEGHGRFESPRTVRVGDVLLEADEFFLNVGARPMIPDMPGLVDVNYFTSSSIMEVDFLPEHLVIVGGSYIGLEFAQMYRRFGSRVTIVEMGPRLISREDEEISAAIEAILKAEGIDVRANAKCLSVKAAGDGIAVQLSCEDDPRELVGSHLLLAVGRKPNTDDLGLDKAGVQTDARGHVIVDDQLRTNVPGIWALGDANGRGAFTHTAYNDYEIVAGNLLDGDSRSVADRIAAYALYIDPPLGRVGMTIRDVKAAGRNALIGKLPMSRVGRARERGETQGFMSVLVDADTGKILGAAILGIEGDEVIHSILDMMYADAPFTVIQRAMHIHPTVSELVPTMFGALTPLT